MKCCRSLGASATVLYLSTLLPITSTELKELSHHAGSFGPRPTLHGCFYLDDTLFCCSASPRVFFPPSRSSAQRASEIYEPKPSLRKWAPYLPKSITTIESSHSACTRAENQRKRLQAAIKHGCCLDWRWQEH